MASNSTAKKDEENKIDLFADEEDVNQLSFGFDTAMAEINTSQDDKNDPETDILFDDVVTARLGPSTSNSTREESKVDSGSTKTGDDSAVAEGASNEIAPSVQKFSVYVGNLTWWTTDENIEKILQDIGVDDLVEVKFFDSRVNGQSKSYCNVCVASERSIRLIHDKLPTKFLYEKRLMVAVPSKSAAAQFEAQSDCKPRVSPTNCCTGACNPRVPMPAGIPPPPPAYGMPPGVPRLGGPPRGNRLPPPGPGIHSPPNHRMGICPPHQNPGHPSAPPHHLNYGPQRHVMPPFHHHNSRPYRPYHQSGGHPPCSFPPSPGMEHHRGPPPQRGNEWMRMPGPHCPPVNHPSPTCPPPGLMLQHHPPTQDILSSPPGISLNEPPPAPHVNPAFFSSQYRSPVPSPESQQNRTPKAREHHNMTNNGYEPPATRLNESKTTAVGHGLSPAELDEIVNRNRTVSTTAISRAVDDAAKGDFAGAIETLVTAISLIKQSRVGTDERCRVLVTSLQDTLHGIESKSYGRARPRMRSKSRSRSRERASLRVHRNKHYSHHYSHRRSRSRSRGRSRSRERYYDRHRSRSFSPSRGLHFERAPNCDDRDRYHHYRDCDYERYKRDHERRERDHSGGKSSLSSNGSRVHEHNEDHHDHSDHRSSSSRR